MKKVETYTPHNMFNVETTTKAVVTVDADVVMCPCDYCGVPDAAT